MTSRYVVPNPRIPATLGTLNIVIGVLMILLGLSLIAWRIAEPLVLSSWENQSGDERTRAKTARVSQINDLERQQRAATDPQQKTEFQATIDSLKDQEEQENLESVEQALKKNPLLAREFWTGAISGLLLNVLMVLAGSGLLAVRPWGRSLALWVAGLKLVRAGGMAGFALMVSIPFEARQTRDASARMQSGSGAPIIVTGTPRPPGADEAESQAIMTSAVVLGWLFSAAVYPGLSLWLLNKRSVQAAFLGGPAPGPTIEDRAEFVEKPAPGT